MTEHFKEVRPIQDISFTVHTFKEGKTYVAYVPELDLSSCGATDEEARRNIRDAVRGFLETSAEMGTLAEILEEAG
jgi:predicted RNase H-like HicB family nuclease